MRSAISRRHFVSAGSSFFALASRFGWGQAPTPATLRIGTDALQPPVAQDFIGLSYEVMQLEDPHFFSAANTGLIECFRQIAPKGILRLGGNTSEFSWWKPTPSTPAPVRITSKPDPGEPPPSTLYAVTPESIRNLRAFLDATNWTCIYGLNLGYGTPATDTAEALFVARTLGPRLAYFQVGNEVDLFFRHLRDPKTWNVDTYLQNWLTIARAVQQAIPGAAFGLPDVARDVTWLPKIAARWPAVQDRPHLVALSHHHYFGGPPSNVDVDIPHLMRVDPVVAKQAELAKPAADALHLALRMTEGNSCFRGGKPGVSDVFAAALWSADYSLRLMKLGYSGINLHGGSGHAVAVSVGGSLVGELLMKDPAAPHPKPFYTPIANQATTLGSGVNTPLNGVYEVQPVGRGLMFARAFAGSTPLEATLGDNPSMPDTASAFAARTPEGSVLVAIFNKDAIGDLHVQMPACQPLRTLTAASLESRTAEIRELREIKGDRAGGARVQTVPAHSAILFRLL